MSNIYTVQTGRFKQQRIHGGGDFLKRDSKNNDGSTDEHFDDQFKDDFFFDESNHEETPNETLDDFDDDSGMLAWIKTIERMNSTTEWYATKKLPDLTYLYTHAKLRQLAGQTQDNFGPSLLKF